MKKKEEAEIRHFSIDKTMNIILMRVVPFVLRMLR